MKGIFSIGIAQKSVKDFEYKCEAAIRNVGRSTKKATIAACEEILEKSLGEVPLDTMTLHDSGYYEVKRRTDTAISWWAYEAIIGYGGNGDPVNPKNGLRASEYMTKVHEDITQYHRVGKSKFLEDPLYEYARNNFPRTVFKYASEGLRSYTTPF